MKKILFLVFILALVFSLASCGGSTNTDNSPSDDGDNTTLPHTHTFVEGKCECGETDPSYVPPHTHNFVEGKCECGETDPSYVPPHTHNFVEGKCECGESDPSYVPPHTHNFVEGKCECGETDPNYKPALKEITGVLFNDANYTYDGTLKTIEITGTLPKGVDVKYTSASGKDAGTYSATATLSGEGYETLVLTATLTISKADITGVSFDSYTGTYNGAEQMIIITDALPSGTNVEYKNNKAYNAGEYHATATITGKNYNTLVLYADLIINKADITGVSFIDKTVTYNGAEQSITISGTLPKGVSVSYTNACCTDAGTYNATATLSGSNYNTLTLTAVLKIEKAAITADIKFNSSIVEYDTQPHYIQIVGMVPKDAIVSYTYNGKSVDSVSAVGTYTVVATISGDNYITKTYTATLIINSKEEQLYSINHNGVIYFQNNLDDNKLYKYSNGTISKVNNDKPEYFFSNGIDLYYYSSSLFSKAIKKISGSTVTTICDISGDYITSDGTYIYFAINKLFGNEGVGIYKIRLDGSEHEPTKIASTEAAYLTVIESNIYYSNLSDGKKLYKVSTNGGTPVMIYDEKVSYIVASGKLIYFDSNKLTGSAIYKYNTTNGEIEKVTTDSGKYLTMVGGSLYYINNDLLSSTIFGDGIYTTNFIGLVGTKIISAESGDGFSSLTSDGTNLYYYKLSTKHFYRYNLASGVETDLMASFTPPVEKITPVGESVIAEYNGEIYYTNNRDGMVNGACLYKYNPTTKAHIKVLANDVAGAWFNGDYLYYSTCILTNYALFRLDMNTGETIKINSSRCENLIFDGDYIYYIDVNLATNNKIMRMSASNLAEPATVLFDEKNVSITGMYKLGETFYFISNPKVGYQYIWTYEIGGNDKGTSLDIKAKHLVIGNSTIYYFDGTSNSVKSCDLSGKNVKTIYEDVDINDMYFADGKLYFSSTDSKNKGLYVYTVSSGTTSKIFDSVADGIVKIDGHVWFINSAVTYLTDYPVHSNDGDAFLYSYNGSTATKK